LKFAAGGTPTAALKEQVYLYFHPKILPLVHRVSSRCSGGKNKVVIVCIIHVVTIPQKEFVKFQF
jgi:hypothetical protein